MNPELINHSYEQIDNTILRLLIYFLAAAVVTLCGVIGYLYREWRRDVNERLDLNKEAIKGYTDVSDALEAIAARIANIEGNLPAKTN